MRDTLPRQEGIVVRGMSQAHHWSLHNGNVPQIPSRALRMRVLLETVEQGHVQGTKRQALLPWLFREALRINDLSLFLSLFLSPLIYFVT